MRKHRIALILAALLLAAVTLTACSGNKSSGDVNTPDSGGSMPGGTSSTQTPDAPGLSETIGGSVKPSGDVNTPDSGEFIPGDTIQSVTFQFEDEEHKQAVEEWLKKVLYAEDYYKFVDGADFDAPFDFDDESPIMAEYFGEGEAHE